MEKSFKHAKKLLLISFTTACFIHFLLIGYSIIFPELPETKVYNVDLKDIEFPLVYKLCFYDLLNPKKRFQELGYGDIWDFYRGRSMYNNTLYGWSGHTKNGSSLESMKSMYVFPWWHNKMYVKYFRCFIQGFS